MGPNFSTPKSLAEQQALSWVARITRAPLNAAAQADFAVWLQLDPCHHRHFDAAVDAWELAGEIDQQRLALLCELPVEQLAPISTAVTTQHWATDNPNATLGLAEIVLAEPGATTHGKPITDQSASVPARWWQRQAMFGAWILAIVVSGMLLAPQAPSRYITGTGEYERLPLADGSVLHLNTNTQVNLQFTDGTRELQLIRGELFIEVAHNANWPLHVHTTEFSATAIGTAFSVAATEQRQWVHVADGKVAITQRRHRSDPLNSPSTLGSHAVGQVNPSLVIRTVEKTDVTTDVPAAVAVALTKGQLLVSQGNKLGAPQYSSQTVASWRHGQLLYRNVALAELVADLNRYHTTQLVIHNPNLAAKRVTAVLNATSFTDAKRALCTSLDLEGHELSPGVVLLQPARN